MNTIAGGENWIECSRTYFEIHASCDDSLWCFMPGKRYAEDENNVAVAEMNRLSESNPRMYFRVLKGTETKQYHRVAYYPAKESTQ